MCNKVDYQLGKDMFERYLHDVEKTISLDKDSLEESINEGADVMSEALSTIMEILIKYKVPISEINAIYQIITDVMLEDSRKLTLINFIKIMLYGEGGASD